MTDRVPQFIKDAMPAASSEELAVACEKLRTFLKILIELHETCIETTKCDIR